MNEVKTSAQARETAKRGDQIESVNKKIPWVAPRSRIWKASFLKADSSFSRDFVLHRVVVAVESTVLSRTVVAKI
jgi:hypothetical protein